MGLKRKKATRIAVEAAFQFNGMIEKKQQQQRNIIERSTIKCNNDKEYEIGKMQHNQLYREKK